MTPEERAKILMVVSTADGGCRSCVEDLLLKLELAFPDEPFAAEFGGIDYDVIANWKRKMDHVEWAAKGMTPEQIAEEDKLLYGEPTDSESTEP